MSKQNIDRIVTQARDARQKRQRQAAEALEPKADLATDPAAQIQIAKEQIFSAIGKLQQFTTASNVPTWGRAADLNHLADQLTELAQERFLDIAGRRRS